VNALSIFYLGLWQTDFVLALVTICISGPGGQYATIVEATPSHDAVRKGVKLFLNPFRKCPKPIAGPATDPAGPNIGLFGGQWNGYR
jgi:hypothetical protein